jgi:hypothetical protein
MGFATVLAPALVTATELAAAVVKDQLIIK